MLAGGQLKEVVGGVEVLMEVVGPVAGLEGVWRWLGVVVETW